jgi:hypothetical protein
MFFSNLMHAQKKTFPRKHQLEKAADFEKYEDAFVDAVDYYMTPSEDKTEADQKRAGTFIMTYVTGSPKVKISILPYIVSATEDCPSCLLVFLGAWAKDALESNVFDNDLRGNLAGVKGVLRYYEAHKDDLGKIRSLEKLLKKEAKGRLKNYIASKLP